MGASWERAGSTAGYPPGYHLGMVDALRMWSARRWRVAVLGGIATAVLVALPTAVIPNPIFGRAIEVTWWSYPIVALTGILGGLLLATCVREPGTEEVKPAEEAKASTLGIAATSVVLMAVALRIRLKNQVSCTVAA